MLSHTGRGTLRDTSTQFESFIVTRGKGIRQTFSDVLNKRRFYNHLPAMKVKSRIACDIWDGYFKFCVERNPWDKTVSDFYMQRWERGGNLSFDEYIGRGYFRLNYYMYTDPRGNVLVDRILKYENLIGELGEVFNKLGIPFDGSLGVSAKTEYRVDRGPYHTMYSDAQKSLVEKVFDPEIRMHGYQF